MFNIKVDINNDKLNIILMSELNELQLENYLETFYDEYDYLEKYTEYLAIITYNQINHEKLKVKKKFDFILSTLSEFWEDPSNCYFSITDKFINRRFNYNPSGEKNMIDIKDFILEKNFEIDNDSKEIDYLNDIMRDNSSIINHTKKYYISNISKLSNTDIIQIYNQIPNEYMQYMFLTNMICSRIHCHLILNNYELLKITKPIFDKYKLIFKYLIGYAWITFINEENCVFNKIKDNDRIIFDINTANLLPIYPFTYDDINQNPYAVILVDKEILNLRENCLSLEMMKDYEKYYGVCDSNEFSRRLNIFINGSNKKGILDIIDWSSCVVTGSVMTACGMKYNPLIDMYKTNNTSELTDSDLSNFFFHYYNDSDIDIVCNKDSIIDFIDVVQNLVTTLRNILGETTTTNIHTSTIIISDEFILNELEFIRKSLKLNNIDINYIKSNFSSQKIKDYFYDKFYIPWKNEQLTNLTKLEKQNEELFIEYLKPIPREDFRICYLNYELNEENIVKKDYDKYFYFKDLYDIPDNDNKLIGKLSESIRFKIKPKETRVIEIFKSKNENFFSVVSRFHMGFVRAIWNGKTVLCLPSYITSMMLQLAVDYKYFSSIRDPIEIVNKYRSRGFGIILNDFEKLSMIYYNSSKIKNADINKKWIEMYKINIKSKKSIKNIFGVKKSSNDIFKPSKYFIGVPNDCFKEVTHNTASTFKECFGSIIKSYFLNISKYKAISDNGKITPLNKNIIYIGWNLSVIFDNDSLTINNLLILNNLTL